MKLHILRHAKTNQHSDSGKDFDRKLLPKGKAQCKILSDHFKEHLAPIHTVFCSDSKRTRQTFELVNDSISFLEIKFQKELYHANFKQILEFFSSLPIDSDVLLIGHNYGISDLVHYITNFDIELRTGEYVCIDAGELKLNEISASTGTICDRFRPMP